jgi:hypothetical protein
MASGSMLMSCSYVGVRLHRSPTAPNGVPITRLSGGEEPRALRGSREKKSSVSGRVSDERRVASTSNRDKNSSDRLPSALDSRILGN